MMYVDVPLARLYEYVVCIPRFLYDLYLTKIYPGPTIFRRKYPAPKYIRAQKWMWRWCVFMGG